MLRIFHFQKWEMPPENIPFYQVCELYMRLN